MFCGRHAYTTAVEPVWEKIVLAILFLQGTEDFANCAKMKKITKGLRNLNIFLPYTYL
jgi:hypothetical protein